MISVIMGNRIVAAKLINILAKIISGFCISMTQGLTGAGLDRHEHIEKKDREQWPEEIIESSFLLSCYS
jgi:hypothetical protein